MVQWDKINRKKPVTVKGTVIQPWTREQIVQTYPELIDDVFWNGKGGGTAFLSVFFSEEVTSLGVEMPGDVFYGTRALRDSLNKYCPSGDWWEQIALLTPHKIGGQAKNFLVACATVAQVTPAQYNLPKDIVVVGSSMGVGGGMWKREFKEFIEMTGMTQTSTYFYDPNEVSRQQNETRNGNRQYIVPEKYVKKNQPSTRVRVLIDDAQSGLTHEREDFGHFDHYSRKKQGDPFLHVGEGRAFSNEGWLLEMKQPNTHTNCHCLTCRVESAISRSFGWKYTEHVRFKDLITKTGLHSCSRDVASGIFHAQFCLRSKLLTLGPTVPDTQESKAVLVWRHEPLSSLDSKTLTISSTMNLVVTDRGYTGKLLLEHAYSVLAGRNYTCHGVSSADFSAYPSNPLSLDRVTICRDESNFFNLPGAEVWMRDPYDLPGYKYHQKIGEYTVYVRIFQPLTQAKTIKLKW